MLLIRAVKTLGKPTLFPISTRVLLQQGPQLRAQLSMSALETFLMPIKAQHEAVSGAAKSVPPVCQERLQGKQHPTPKVQSRGLQVKQNEMQESGPAIPEYRAFILAPAST